jgi:hypothetical protein
MYFSNRRGLDTLGLTNKEVAHLPLRKTPTLFRNLPSRYELPSLIFKRIQSNLIEKYKPDILFTFDFMLRDIIKEVPFNEMDDDKVKVSLKRWQKKMEGLVEPLYGGLSNIRRLGYSPIIVFYSNGFCSLYFVSQEVRQRHKAILISQGFKHTSLTL